MKIKHFIQQFSCLTGVFLFILSLGACNPSLDDKGNFEELEDVFGQTHEEIQEILGWDLQNAENEPLSDQQIEGYALKVKQIDFLGMEADCVHMVFMEDPAQTPRLTLLYAEYPPGENMDPVSESLQKIWGEARTEMYCSWPDLIYWPQGLWAGGSAYNDPASFLQTEKSGKLMWGSKETIGDVLADEENPRQIFESWIPYARTYIQSLKNDWEQVEQEPLVTAVLFEKCEDFKKENVVIIDGFQKFMGTYMKEKF